MYQTLLLSIAALVSGYTGADVFPAPLLAINETGKEAVVLTQEDKEEILWLSRIIFSETKFSEEMRLVGWVVRNRVEAEYRGSTYKEVAQSPHQFSGLNPADAQYGINIKLGYGTENESWQRALAIAEEIYFANHGDRPFAINVLHFYSPISATGTPEWVETGTLHSVVRGTRSSVPRVWITA